MPRQARVDAAGALHHIICRGIEKRNIFRSDIDRSDFLDRLEKVLPESGTPCYAWALMPNHFHLLLRTGKASISKVMSRLLSGYAGSFNRRHRRSGHLFQNRYKSILCQEETYLLELVRYIHLNPLRSGLVSTMDDLDRYPFCGHGALMGYFANGFQDGVAVLNRFGRRTRPARTAYRSFVEKGAALGRRPDLTGGGLIRSMGGWSAVKALRRMPEHVKGDERILGDGDFVEAVLSAQRERLERRHAIRTQGIDFEALVGRVGELFGLAAEKVLAPGKQRQRAAARSVLCFWAVRELGMTAVETARRLGITQSAVSKAACRGERLADEKQLKVMPPAQK